MSLYILVGNDSKSSMGEMPLLSQKIIPFVTNPVDLAEWMLETDAKNTMIHGWQTVTLVTVRLKYLEGFAWILSRTI